MASLGYLLGLLPTGAAAQTLLIDTGPGTASTNGAYSLFGAGATNCSPAPACQAEYQFLAGRFTLAQPATLSSVQAWMNVGFAGSLDVTIYTDDGTVPGISLFTKRYAVQFSGSFDANWVPFDDFDTVLPAGTFWVAFEPVYGSNMNGSMPGGVPNPLQVYALDYEFGYQPFFFTSGYPGLGVRIYGTNGGTATYGSAARGILVGSVFGFPFNDDFTSGGIGRVYTLQGAGEIPAGISLAHGRLIEGGLSAGAWSSTGICYSPYQSCTEAIGAARSVSWREFTNTGPDTVAFNVNTVLDGGFTSYSGTLPSADANVYVFDTAMFADTLANSGEDPATFLMNGVSMNEPVSDLFPSQALLASASQGLSGPLDQRLSVPLSTDFVTIDPNQSVTIMFDVSVSAPEGAGVNFFDTLAPAPVFLADVAGDPVTDLTTGGPAAPAVGVPAAVTLAPATSTGPIGTAHTVTAVATDAGGAALRGVTVEFAITSGPNVHASGPVIADANGRAQFTYSGAGGAGTDSIQAHSGAAQSVAVQRTWTSPGPLDHLAISPATATIVAGGSQSYTAEGLDVFDNDVGDLTAGTTFTIDPYGTCTGATCTASMPGPHTVTGTNDFRSAYATLTVTAAPVAPPPMADGEHGGVAARFSKSTTLAGRIDVAYDVSGCAAESAVVLYGALGSFSSYQGCALAGGGHSGSLTIDATGLSNVWFNVVWTNGSTAGHPGFGAHGAVDVPRTWTAAGFCAVTADDHSDSTCP